MQSYRSKQTINAVQYRGEAIPEVTCAGGERERIINNCEQMRAHLPHVHTKVTGGLTVLKPGDWVFPERGGPFGVASDEKFRANWEVPEEEAPVEPEPGAGHTDEIKPTVEPEPGAGHTDEEHNEDMASKA